TRSRDHFPQKPSPNRQPVRRSPRQPPAVLIFKTDEIVVLELGAKRQTQPVLHQRDFILRKQTEQLNGALVGIERDCVAVVEFVGAKTVTGAPNNVLPFAQEETVLQVNVKRVAVLVQNRSIADSPVIINLQLQIRTIGEG